MTDYEVLQLPITSDSLRFVVLWQGMEEAFHIPLYQARNFAAKNELYTKYLAGALHRLELRKNPPVASKHTTETPALITVHLRDCPFCAGKPYVAAESIGEDSLDEVWRIYCADCPAMMEGEQTAAGLERIVEAWNHGQ